ncbi:MAG: PAS domain S-box protein [Chloroflexota bacterium]|nr:MAG: PAS domain S-box protein [Chloroflexota bacterium]
MEQPRVPGPADRCRVGLFPAAAIATAVAAVVAQGLLPRGDVVTLGIYFVTALAAAVVAGVATWRHRVEPVRPWWIVVAAMAISVVLNLVTMVEALVGATLVDPDLLGTGYLLPYLVLAIGLFDLVRVQPTRFDRAALLDALIVVLGLGVGSFLFGTAVAAPVASSAPGFESAVAATFGVGLPAVALVLWLAMVGGPARGVVALLLLAVVAQSTGDSFFGLELANEALRLPRESAWLASLALLAAATVRGAGARRAAGEPPLIGGQLRLWLLGLAIVAPAIDSAYTYVADRPRELVSLLVLVVAGLAIVRITYLLRQVNRLAADTEAYERRTAELDRAKREYQTLVDAAPGMAWTSRIIDPESGASERLFIGPQALTITGYPAESFMSGRHWRDVMHPEDVAGASERYRTWIRAVASGAAPDGVAAADEYRIIRSDGGVRWLRDTHHLVRGTADEASTIHGLVVDITEQRVAQDEVRASEERFRTLVEQLPGVVILREIEGDRPTRFAYISPSCEAILGFTAEQVPEGADPWPAVLDPVGQAPVLEARRRHLATQSSETVVARVAARPDRPGLARWVEATWLKVQDLDEHRWLSLAVALDVSALREAQDELRALNADLEDRIMVRTSELRAAQLEAERASRAKSEFLSSMSHELRTPLNAILGFGQLLQLAPLARPDRESADEIIRAGRHLLEMIEAVLEFSRMDAGRITLSIEPVELGPLVRETLDLRRPGAAERGVSIEESVSAGASIVVLADRRRLGQILLALISNAITYNRPGGNVTVAAEVDGERARIRVRDTGVGIPADRLSRLFEPFETMRGDHAARQSLGLGLALSSRLAELMGGSIRATSTVDAGSEFVVEIPVAAGETVELASTEDDATAAGRPTRTVLYIEDNLANLHLVERVLVGRLVGGRFGIRVLAAIQGRIGLELAREHRPDLILLDLHLPDSEPGEILSELQADERTSSLPVVILSSDTTPRMDREMRRLGATDYLTKPLDIDHFLDVVEGLLRAP